MRDGLTQRVHTVARLTMVGMLLLGAACGGNGAGAPVPVPTAPGPPGSPGGLGGNFSFTYMPIDWLPFTQVSQIGVAQSGSISWRVQFFGLTSVGRNVYAPADGVVMEIAYEPTDVNEVRPWIDFQGAGGVRFRLDSLATTLVAVGDQVKSGQVVGTRPKDDRGRDLGIFLSVRLPQPTFLFLRPDRYRYEMVYAADPLPMFAEPLRSAIEAWVEAPTLRRLSFDEPGTLHGRWYLEGLDASKTFNVANARDRLAFYDVRVASGETLLRATIPQEEGGSGWSGTPVLVDGTPHPRDVRAGPPGGVDPLGDEPGGKERAGEPTAEHGLLLGVLSAR